MDTDRIKGAAQDLGGKVQEAAGKAFGDTSTQAEGIVRQVAGKGQNYYGQAKDAVSNVAESATDYANQAYRNAGPQAERGTQLVRDRVGDNPLTAVLLAGAIGYLLALAIHGRN